MMPRERRDRDSDSIETRPCKPQPFLANARFSAKPIRQPTHIG